MNIHRLLVFVTDIYVYMCVAVARVCQQMRHTALFSFVQFQRSGFNLRCSVYVCV